MVNFKVFLIETEGSSKQGFVILNPNTFWSTSFFIKPPIILLGKSKVWIFNWVLQRVTVAIY